MLQQEVMCTSKLDPVLQVMLSYHSSDLSWERSLLLCHQASPGAKGTVQP